METRVLLRLAIDEDLTKASAMTEIYLGVLTERVFMILRFLLSRRPAWLLGSTNRSAAKTEPVPHTGDAGAARARDGGHCLPRVCRACSGIVGAEVRGAPHGTKSGCDSSRARKRARRSSGVARILDHGQQPVPGHLVCRCRLRYTCCAVPRPQPRVLRRLPGCTRPFVSTRRRQHW